jgi:hypothetical protein
MVATLAQVSCINKRQHQDPHERIQYIGGTNPERSRWKLSETDAIAGIKSNKYSFYVTVGGKTVTVIIATHNGREYLKTTADGYAPNNLLNLPECP